MPIGGATFFFSPSLIFDLFDVLLNIEWPLLLSKFFYISSNSICSSSFIFNLIFGFVMLPVYKIFSVKVVIPFSIASYVPLTIDIFLELQISLKWSY